MITHVRNSVIKQEHLMKLPLNPIGSKMAFLTPQKHIHLHVPKFIILPVRPPILPKAPLTRSKARLRAGPAEDCTLSRPWEAFEAIFEAASLDFVAVSDAACAASEVVEACRRAV